MTMTWRHLPTAARTIAVAASDAVVAAQEHDRDRFGVAVETLAATDGSGLVLGAVVRSLLEEFHPDGLDSADVRRIIEHCVAGTAWQPSVDPHVLLVLLAGALGIHDHDDQESHPTPQSLARHAALLVADLLTAAPRPLQRYLAAAFAEVERAELHD
jgi:hypothetical protein